MKKIKLILILALGCNLLWAQQKKPAATRSVSYVVPKKAPTPQPAPASQAPPVQPTRSPAQQPTSEYDRYNSQRQTAASERRNDSPDVGSVVKINFMRLIIRGIDLEFEKRIMEKSSLILTTGYYFGGPLQGGYRLGLDYRQYLGQSLSPAGLYVSGGAVGNFLPIADNALVGNATVLLLNLRGLVGYQFLTGHFVFDIAAGGSYAFVSTTKAITDKDGGALTVGLLPAFKMSLGYAF